VVRAGGMDGALRAVERFREPGRRRGQKHRRAVKHDSLVGALNVMISFWTVYFRQSVQDQVATSINGGVAVCLALAI
jgi:hypothetical protein